MSEARQAIDRLRASGVNVSVVAGRLKLTGNAGCALSPDALNRVRDLKAEIVAVLEMERQPANGNEDVAAKIKSSRSRNSDAEKRQLTDCWGLCGGLAQNEWQTPRGRLWICEPCRDAGLLEQLQGAWA
jgi:hypothetical protein